MSILRTVFKEIFNLPPTGAELRTDQNYLNQQASDLVGLIPWKDHEMDILSIKYKKASARGKSLNELGSLDSIYHEPMLAMAGKYYRRQKDVKLRVVFNEKDRYSFFTAKGETKAYYESRLIGRIRDGEYLLAPRKKGALLRYIRGSEEYGVILRGDEAIAQIISPKKAESKNPRAVIILSKLSAEQMIVFKGYVFYLLMNALMED